MRIFLVCGYLISAVIQGTAAIGLDVHDVDSIKSAAKIVASDLISFYTGNDTGILPSPYWWWESGAMWGALVDYWHYTGDTTYNDITYSAILSQLGTTNNFMLPTQETNEGNDDQAFWGFAAMSAAEKNFTAPPGGTPSWLQIVINLWESQVVRWDTSTCDGGLRWQIYSTNSGYDYKNSIANGAFFQFSARLAHFTGNQTYVAWAEKAWDWVTDIGLISEDYHVFDGSNDLLNCSEFDHTEWTYTLGVYLYGAATMYNLTNGSTTWETRTAGLLASSATFFTPYTNATDIMYEPSCELDSSCNTDQFSFKAYISRWMWATAKIAPFTSNAIHTLLQASASAAAGACTGGTDGTTCGAKWYIGGNDGTTGVGQQMSALEVIQGLLVNETSAVMHFASVHLSTVITVPVTNSTTNSTISTNSTGVPSSTNSSGSTFVTDAPVPSSTYVLSSGASISGALKMMADLSTVWLSCLVAVSIVFLV